MAFVDPWSQDRNAVDVGECDANSPLAAIERVSVLAAINPRTAPAANYSIACSAYALFTWILPGDDGCTRIQVRWANCAWLRGRPDTPLVIIVDARSHAPSQTSGKAWNGSARPQSARTPFQKYASGRSGQSSPSQFDRRGFGSKSRRVFLADITILVGVHSRIKLERLRLGYT